MKVAIYVTTQQKGLLTAIGHLLSQQFGFDITFVVENNQIGNIVCSLLQGSNFNLVILPEIEVEKPKNVIEEAKAIEDRYGILLSLLMSEDRALGQGYLFNVEKVPDIKRASWSHEKKLKTLVTSIKKWEIAFKGFDFVISHKNLKERCLTSLISEVRFFSLNPIKWGDRLIWSDNEYLTNNKFIKRMKEYMSNLEEDYSNVPNYEIEAGHAVNRDFSFSYLFAIKHALITIRSDLKKSLSGIQRKDGYRMFGWVPSSFRQVRNYRYVKSLGHRPEEIKNLRIVFFPLHLEPEIALLSISPEFSNSMEVITWISKSLPADAILVIKEHFHSFAVRSKWYYRQINKIGNVVWAHPDHNSWDWIKQSDVVATITGTVGIEAIQMKKPVLSFGKHQAINHLPAVSYVSNYVETSKAVNAFLNGSVAEKEFEIAKRSLAKAQIDSSFNLPSYKEAYGSTKLDIEMAEVALKNLFKEFPELLQN